MENLLFVLIPVVAVVGFVAFWQSIVWMIGQIGGWSQLARHFKTNREPVGDSFGWKTVWIGWLGSYRSSVNIVVSLEGIYLQPIYFFRAGHPPLLIPWEAITQLEQTQLGFLTNTQLDVRPIGGTNTKRLRLYGKTVAESIQRNAPKRLTYGDEFV